MTNTTPTAANGAVEAQVEIAYGVSFDVLRRIAEEDICVLITGETGTGKTPLAEQLHKLSVRSENPFDVFVGSGSNESTACRQLFGTVANSKPGIATISEVGLLDQVGEGTLLIDEVGDCPLGLQTRLLRLLITRQFCPVGSTTMKTTPARFVFTSNQHLLGASDEGRFRKDLYHRICDETIDLPPLRERIEDIGPLAHHFLDRRKKLDASALDVLRKHPWPGNVRELEHTLGRAVRRSKKDTLFGEDIENVLVRLPGAGQSSRPATADESKERQSYLDVLNEESWNKSRAAKRLGVSRPTLYKKIQRYNLEADKPWDSESSG